MNILFIVEAKFEKHEGSQCHLQCSIELNKQWYSLAGFSLFFTGRNSEAAMGRGHFNINVPNFS